MRKCTEDRFFNFTVLFTPQKVMDCSVVPITYFVFTHIKVILVLILGFE